MKQKFKNMYMRVAQETAKLSYCERAKVGCVIVKGNMIFFGYNGTAPGAPNVCEDENGDTHNGVIHAEENACRKLLEANEDGKGAVVFLTLSPCLRCSKLLYDTGIREVYYRDSYRSMDGVEYLIKNGARVEKL